MFHHKSNNSQHISPPSAWSYRQPRSHSVDEDKKEQQKYDIKLYIMFFYFHKYSIGH